MALKRLDDIHYEAIALLLEKKPKTEIAKQLGVHRNTITNWERDPLFQRELKRTVVTRTHSRLNELVDAMMETAISQGNAAMAKLILQMNDMLTDRVSVEAKVESDNIDYAALDDELEAFNERLHNDEE
jgi:IS30 family transposase